MANTEAAEPKTAGAEAGGGNGVTHKSKKRKRRGRRRAGAAKKSAQSSTTKTGGSADYPRHAVRKALRIPTAILEQNAGKACTERESAKYSGVGYHGPFRVELSSSLKFGFLSRPVSGSVELTDLGKKVLRPQSQADELNGLRQAVLNAPKLADVYKHYRGENIPDEPFFGNALLETFKIPKEKHEEFKAVFFESLDDAKLTETHGQKRRVVDVSTGAGVEADTAGTLKRLEKIANVEAGDTCFVMMPFADPTGAYYKTIYEPAIKKA